MATACINRLIELFQQSLFAVGATPTMADVERLGMVVHQCMGAKTRAYHTTHHVFGLCEGATPIQTLAALFHDTVYYQLDAGLPAVLQPLLADVVRLDSGGVFLSQPAATTSTTDAHDLLPQLAQVFGYRFGQQLPVFGGMNEFLSAVAAVRLLAPHLPPPTCLHIAACIEATIAFRQDGPDGRSALDALSERLQGLLQDSPCGLNAADAHTAASAMVSDAMALANRDVGGFAEDDPAVFLAQTWLLIEESNKPLAAIGLYALREYREALQRMDAFLTHLNPAAVFQQFQGAPDPATLAALTRQAHANIAFSARYLRAKLLAMGVIEAFAHLTGGDAPISMFLGDVAHAVSPLPLPNEEDTHTVTTAPDVDAGLLRVLEHGRARASSTDLSASPTAAFIYKELGEAGLRAQWRSASQYFGGTLGPLDFLRQCPTRVVLPLLALAAQTAISRRERLYQLRDTLLAQ